MYGWLCLVLPHPGLASLGHSLTSTPIATFPLSSHQSSKNKMAIILEVRTLGHILLTALLAGGCGRGLGLEGLL